MKFSGHIKQCLDEVEAKPEYESDLQLVHLVKIQRLTEQIHDLNTRDDDVDDVPGIPRAPVPAYQFAFHTELDRLERSLPPSLKDDSKPSAPSPISWPLLPHRNQSLIIILRTSSNPLPLGNITSL